ncbi:MAG TPA: hypothetical protein PLB89_04895 [Flavobacteriales bacterium]|nr:hypothetical protein [Flavobacteriales bacterium]
MSDKTYIGTGWQKDGSYYITIELDVNALLALAKVNKHGKSIVRATLAKRLKPSVLGTHTIYVQPERDLEDKEQAEHGRIADLQEIEVRAHDLAG